MLRCALQGFVLQYSNVEEQSIRAAHLDLRGDGGHICPVVPAARGREQVKQQSWDEPR